MSDFYDALECRAPQDRERALTGSLARQLQHAKANTESYREILSAQDTDQFDALKRLADYPVTRKSELIEKQKRWPPFGGLTAFGESLVTHIFASPGPIYEASTRHPDYWRFARALYATGLRQGEVVHNSFSYHLTPAGSMAESGCHALGCTVVPAGVGQTELQVQTMHDLKPTGYVGTPSFLKILLEKADEMGKDVSPLNKALVSGEALPPPLRAFFMQRGIHVLQCYATADLGLIAYESTPDSGLIVDEGVYVEIVRPGTGDPVPDGEVGEVVVTTLNPSYPLIRFATGDLSAMMEGQSSCGRTNRRIKGWMGRADQTAKVRGMFVHPEQVAAIIDRHAEVTKARLVIDWVQQRDQMTLHCETDEPSESLAKAIGDSVRACCKVRGEVDLVAVGSLANDGLVIEDIRQYDV